MMLPASVGEEARDCEICWRREFAGGQGGHGEDGGGRRIWGEEGERGEEREGGQDGKEGEDGCFRRQAVGVTEVVGMLYYSIGSGRLVGCPGGRLVGWGLGFGPGRAWGRTTAASAWHQAKQVSWLGAYSAHACRERAARHSPARRVRYC